MMLIFVIPVYSFYSYVLINNFDSSLNDLQNTKQDNLVFTTPLLKDVSNNITIDLSGYAIGNIKGTKATLNDPSGNSLIFYHNNPGIYFTDNSLIHFLICVVLQLLIIQV